MDENRVTHKFFGMKPQVFIPILSAIAILSIVVIVRQSFKEKPKERTPASAAERERAKGDIDSLRDAVRKSPGSARAYLNLGRALAKAGRTEEAVGSFKRATNLDRNFDDAFFDLARTSGVLGRKDDAIRAYREVVRIDPGNAEAHYELGVAQIGIGEGATAAESFGRAIAIDPTYADRLPQAEGPESVATTPSEGGGEAGGTASSEPEDAEEAEEEGPAAPTRPTATDDSFAPPQVSPESLGDSILFDNESFEMTMGMGSLYSSLGQHGNAVTAFSKAVGLKPQSAAAHLGLGLSHLGAGNRTAATAEYNTLTSLDPAMAAKLLDKLNQ